MNTYVHAINNDFKSMEPAGGEGVLRKGNNQESIMLAYNPVFHARTKLINIQHHYIRDETA